MDKQTGDEGEVNPGNRVERSTRANIDLSAISHNISEIRKRIGKRRDLMAVVKADGYGHGAVEVSRAALRSGATCLGVALPEEGRQLRDNGVEVPILVMGLIQPEEACKVIDSELEQAISTAKLAEALDQEAGKTSTRVKVHLKIDTGMGRIGVLPKDALALIRKVSGFQNLDLEGVFSHFPSADESNKTFTRRQIETFNALVKEIEGAGFKIAKRHMANSAAVLDLPESYFDLVRPGIMIYGLYPSKEVGRSIKLKPAMSLRTHVTYVKSVPAGTPISYGRTFCVERNAVVATLPVGYADGYNRLLSNQGSVFIRGRSVPLIGRVCMDMCMIDVSEIGAVRIGDEVVLFGENPPVDEIADKIGTINYEVVCAVGKRVPRVYVQ